MSRQPHAGHERQEGTLLFFPPRALLTSRRVETAGATGTILLFTGVRYERHDDASASVPLGASALTHGGSPAPVRTGRRGPRRRA